MHLFDPNKMLNIAYAISLFFIGYLMAKRVSLIAERSLNKRFSRHHTMLARRFVFYLIFTIFL